MTPTAIALSAAVATAPVTVHDELIRIDGGRLPVEAITPVMKAHQGDIMRCHDPRANWHAGRLEALVVLHVEGGRLRSVDVAGETEMSRQVGLCIAESAQGWADLPEASGWLDLRYVCDPSLGNGL